MQIDDHYIEYIAKMMWADAFASFMEQEYPKLSDAEKEKFADWENMSGRDWFREAPEPPQSAYEGARQFAESLVRVNDMESMDDLIDLAEREAGYEIDPEAFLHDLTLEAAGHGVSWFDDHDEFDINIPDIEYYSWDGEELDFAGVDTRFM